MPQVILTERAHIHVCGLDAQHFLHNLVTTDIEGLRHGAWMPGALLSAQGKIMFAFLVTRERDRFLLEVALQDAADFHKRLRFYRLRAKVELSEPLPVNISVSWKVRSVDSDSHNDGRFAEFDVWRAVSSKNDCSENEAWTLLRIENGIAEAHVDYAYNDAFPHDVNLDQTHGVSFNKGCYVGQEVVSRMQHRGTARRRLMVATGNAPVASGAQIKAGGKVAGSIGSACSASGLALVRLDRVKDALDRGLAITSGDAAITLQFPAGVSYGWPSVNDPES